MSEQATSRLRARKRLALIALLGVTASYLSNCGDEGQEGESPDAGPVIADESAIGGVAFLLPLGDDEAMEKTGSSSPPEDDQRARLQVWGTLCFSSSCSEPGESTCTIVSTSPERIVIEADFQTIDTSMVGGARTCTDDCTFATADCGEIVLSGESITIDDSDSDLFVIPLPVTLPWDTARDPFYMVER